MTTNHHSKAYHSIVETANTLFMKHGMKRITVEEICREAGVSKMTFYRNFDNKDDVAEKIILDISERNMKRYREIMKGDIPYAEKIQQIVVLKKEASQEISEEFIKDILQNDNIVFIEHLNNQRKKVSTEYIKDFKDAQKKGEVRQDIKPEFILYMLDTMYEKMKDPRLAAMYKDTHEATIEVTKFFFYGILSNEK
ncbi:MAG: TetR/AcrR family transcriptional regulator [Saprospiraceae bacterium]